MPTITLDFSVEDAARVSGALERGHLTTIDEVTGDFLPATIVDAKNFIRKRLITFVQDSERQVARDAADDTIIPVDIT